MDRVVSCTCEPPGNLSDMRDEDPGFGTLDGFLPIPGQSAALSKPGEGALHGPSSRQNPEPLCCIGALDDLDSPAPDTDQDVAQFWPAIAAVGEDAAKSIVAGQKRRNSRLFLIGHVT